MLPFFKPPSLPLPFGLELSLFGLLSTGGTFLGAVLAARKARTYGPGDDTPLRNVVTSAVVGGLIGAHFAHVFLYHRELLEQNAFSNIVRVWDGLSSMGGVLGALTGIIFWFRRNHVKLRPYLDALALGTAPGWAIARVGCLMARDHPGKIADGFFLAWGPWEQSAGHARHDLGFYDAIALGLITALLYYLARKPRPQGFLMGVLACIYSVQRFLTDFLRADEHDPYIKFVDAHYFGLTPAQYIVIGLFAVGVWLLVSSRQAPLASVSAASRKEDKKEDRKRSKR